MREPGVAEVDVCPVGEGHHHDECRISEQETAARHCLQPGCHVKAEVAAQQIEAHEADGGEAALQVAQGVGEGDDEEIEPREETAQAASVGLFDKGVEAGGEEVEHEVGTNEPVGPRGAQYFKGCARSLAATYPEQGGHEAGGEEGQEAEAEEVAPFEMHAEPARDEHEHVDAADAGFFREYDAQPPERFGTDHRRPGVAQRFKVGVEHHDHEHGQDAEQFHV